MLIQWAETTAVDLVVYNERKQLAYTLSYTMEDNYVAVSFVVYYG